MCFFDINQFLTLSNKVEKCLCIQFVCLAHFNSRTYSPNIFKLVYVICICYSMDRIKNGIYMTNGSSTEAHKMFPLHYGLWGENA